MQNQTKREFLSTLSLATENLSTVQVNLFCQLLVFYKPIFI